MKSSYFLVRIIFETLLLCQKTRVFCQTDMIIRKFTIPFILLFGLVLSATNANALEPIVIGEAQEKILIVGELYEGRGDSLQIETAPGPDKIAGRMTVQSSNKGANPNWVVFALTNPTDKRIERWFTAERYSLIDSGLFSPNLDAGHIAQVTPSLGFRPQRIANDDIDIYKIELEPGATVTFVAELVSNRFPRFYLWKARVFEQRLRDSTLFNGILLGVTGLLAIFLTAIFVANHKAIFPATALVAWAVTAYLCVDFGFWHKLFQLSPEDNAIYRAASEAAMAASIILFLYTFLRLSLWHNWIRLFFSVWLIAQSTLIFVAIFDAKMAASLARLSFALIAIVGSIIIAYLAMRGQDRAMSLVPSWMLFLVWLFASAVTILGQVSGDIFVAGIVSGLVLIVLLFGFTVTQFAFRSNDIMYGGAPPSQLQQRSLALDGAGAVVWEWNAKRNEISVSEEVDIALGLPSGTLNCNVDEWINYLHTADKDRFRMLLWSIQEKNGGELNIDFRMRRHDSSYLWFELSAHSAPISQYRSLKCVGLLRDVTHTKRAQERLMHDAVHDNLTSLPNRELFLDRLNTAITRTQEEGANRPTVFFIDIDRFKTVNDNFGLVIGDSMLLTVSRRLTRHLSPLDTLARVGGDQFAILLVTETEPKQIAMLAERVRRSLRSPMTFEGKEIILTGSIGIAVYDGHQSENNDLLKEAEIAMYRAKRSGTDRVEIFKPAMRNEEDDRVAMESDLRRAIDRRQIKILFQPIMYLEDEDIAGFEAVMKWDHPKLGRLNLEDFISIAENAGIVGQLGNYILDRAARQAAKWQKIITRPDDPLFVNVNISSRQLFRHDLIKDIRLILKREILPKGSLRLSVKEALVMENPEHAAEILDWLKGAGASLCLDEFGTGYSSLSYLNRFPFDLIKIHRTLIQQSTIEDSGPAVVRSIITLAHELGKEVLAEGVIDVDETTLLRSLNCEFVQGQYYGDLIGEKEVINLLNALKKSGKVDGHRSLTKSTGSQESLSAPNMDNMELEGGQRTQPNASPNYSQQPNIAGGYQQNPLANKSPTQSSNIHSQPEQNWSPQQNPPFSKPQTIQNPNDGQGNPNQNVKGAKEEKPFPFKSVRPKAAQ